MTPADDDRRLDVIQRVINHLFGTGLTLAGVLSLQRGDSEIAARLRTAIDQLDAAIRELQHTALQAPAQGHDQLEPSLDTAIPNARRRLSRITSEEIVAYAVGNHDFFHASDHRLWAHESDGLLLSARSGIPFARRDGKVFVDLASDVPLYYEHDHAGPSQTPVA